MKKRLYAMFPFADLTKEKGQSLIILAFSFVGLIALLGLGLDLGLVYVERTALKRAIDAAALSGVSELANEEEAAKRVIQYLELNDYDLDDTNIYVSGCIQDKEDYYDGGATCPTLYRNCGDGDKKQLVNPDFAYPYWISVWKDDTGGHQIPDDDAVNNVFYINTYDSQGDDHGEACKDGSPKVLGAANKVIVTGTVKVDMNFFSLLGRPEVPVNDKAVAQNVDNLDVAIVLDRSGSMEFTPICYNCWSRNYVDSADYAANVDAEAETPRYVGYYTYPTNGQIYNMGLSESFAHQLRVQACTTASYDADSDQPDGWTWPGSGNMYAFKYADTVYQNPGDIDHNYMIIEAELYSHNSAPPDNLDSGVGYWAFQRGEGNYLSEFEGETEPTYPSQGTSIDGIGAHMAHHPSLVEYSGAEFGHSYDIDDANTFEAPRLEYDFQFYQKTSGGDEVDWGDPTNSDNKAYIWARVHVGLGLDYDDADFPEAGWNGEPVEDLDNAYWFLRDSVTTPDFPVDPTNEAIQVVEVPDTHSSDSTHPSGRNYWYWVKLGEVDIEYDRTYRLYFFAGSVGYSVDRFIITNKDISGDPYYNDNNFDSSSRAGDAVYAPATTASAYRSACDVCNLIYGQNTIGVTCNHPWDGSGEQPPFPTYTIQNGNRNHGTHALFGEWENPMRATKEAIKLFISRLDASRDQVGFISYTGRDGNIDTVTNKEQLTCKVKQQKQGGFSCVEGSNPYSHTEVLIQVEDVRAQDRTPTAAGLREGLEMLAVSVDGGTVNTECLAGNNDSSCSRGGNAQRVIVLITDGVPNETTYGNSPGCSSSNAPEWSENNSAPFRCVLKYAQDAADSGVTVYTIGLGDGIDWPFLQEVAKLGNGQAFRATTEYDLDNAFRTILSNVYIRLVQ